MISNDVCERSFDSFFNSVKVVKELLSPLGVGIRQAAKFEHCWAGPENKVSGAQVTEGCKLQIFGVRQKVKDEKKKGLQNSRNGSKERALTKEDGPHTNSLQFAVQSLPTPSESGQNRLQKMDTENFPCSCWKSNVSWESKQAEFNGQSVEIFRDKDVKKKGNHVSFECLIGFISDGLAPNLENLGERLRGNDRQRSTLLHPSSDFNHLKVFITSILERQQLYANRFLRNLKFAKVGGVP